LARQLLINSKHYAGKRIQGGREYQEDDFIIDNKPGDFLMVLADGMGGHHGGAYASNCTVQAFKGSYQASFGHVARRLKKALLQANHQLALETHVKPELYGMGCTLVGISLHEYQLEWVSVGDSPLWLYQDDSLRRLNADHSMRYFLQEQVRRGHLTPEQVASHPERNILFSALTGGNIEMLDQSSAPLKVGPGDCILLASDGLFTLSEGEICKVLRKVHLSAKELVNELLQAVQNKGKWDQDNTTVLIVKIPPREAPPKPLSKSWKIGALLIATLILTAVLTLSQCSNELIPHPKSLFHDLLRG